MRSPNFEIAFSIGKFHVYWYAILLAVGIAVAMFVTDLRSKGRSVPKDIALDLCILGMPFGALGARLFACLCHEVAWKDFFDLTRPGLSFFGGLIFAAAAILVYLGLRKVSLGEMTDIAAPGVFAGLGIAVWGDFFNRSHYGPLVEKSGLKWFPLATIGDDMAIHYAAFFYEFLLCVVLIVLYYALFRRKIRRVGARFPLMALLFCLGRFIIDAIRVDKAMVGPIAFDQIWELVIAALCIVCLVMKGKRTDPPTPAEPAESMPEEPQGSEEPFEMTPKEDQGLQ